MQPRLAARAVCGGIPRSIGHHRHVEPVGTWLYVLASAFVLALCWALLWSIPALRWRRNDIADVAWGLTFPVLAALTGGVVIVLDPFEVPRASLVLVLVTLWGMRLAVHIGRRAIHHAGEDRRYAAMRASWGRNWWWRSILQVFVLQALIATVVAQPVLIAVNVSDGNDALGWIDLVAAAVFVCGFALEATADRQLRRFVARKQAGEVEGYLTTGVWSWSRHPNYAGDAILWWGFGLFGVATAVATDAPLLVIPALVGPLVMNAFLRWGSGVPLAERGRAGKPGWDEYAARTSAFFPRPPRA